MVARRATKWRDLTSAQRSAVVVAGVAQVVLQAAALWDLRRRSTAQLRGSRLWWVAASFLNYVGPIAYFVVGRRR